jgi:hypothetical protein
MIQNVIWCLWLINHMCNDKAYRYRQTNQMVISLEIKLLKELHIISASAKQM